MKIYKIIATTKENKIEKFSPVFCNKDETEMLKIAKNIKEEYIKLEVKYDEYEYIKTETIEVYNENNKSRIYKNKQRNF